MSRRPKPGRPALDPGASERVTFRTTRAQVIKLVRLALREKSDVSAVLRRLVEESPSA